MRVLIITEGGKDIGFGHITRCTSIYQAFEEREVEPELIVNGDEPVHDFVKDKNCKIFAWLSNRESLFAALRDADIVFVDSYLADYDLYENISKMVKTTVYFDDDIRMNYPKGFVVNGAILAEQMFYPERKGVTYLLGARYAPLRREFWHVPEKPIRDVLETVMITFGGADIRNLTPRVLKLLVDTYPRLVKKVIIGKSFRNTTEIEALKDYNTELVYYPDAAEMKKFMLESDIAISTGGQTLYELARVGLPTIAVSTVDSRLNSIYNWKEMGFIEYAGEWKDRLLTEAIKQKMKLLKNKSTRDYKRRVGNKLIDGKGSTRIVEELLSDVYKGKLVLRQATFEDAHDIFNLANDDVIRKNSFKPGKIEWEHHLEWLKEKLVDSNCSFFIVECLGQLAGQVRFDVTSQQGGAVVNISLKKNMRGLGLSPVVINESTEKLMKLREDVKLIRAYVKAENIASMKAFEKAGFKFLESTIINSYKARVYEKVVAGDKQR